MSCATLPAPPVDTNSHCWALANFPLAITGGCTPKSFTALYTFSGPQQQHLCVVHQIARKHASRRHPQLISLKHNGWAISSPAHHGTTMAWSATAAQTLSLLLLCCAAAPRLRRRRRCRCATAAASQVRFLLPLLSRCCPSCCCAAACTAPHALRDCAAAAQALHSCIFAAAPLPPLLSQPLLPLC